MDRDEDQGAHPDGDGQGREQRPAPAPFRLEEPRETGSTTRKTPPKESKLTDRNPIVMRLTAPALGPERATRTHPRRKTDDRKAMTPSRLTAP